MKKPVGSADAWRRSDVSELLSHCPSCLFSSRLPYSYCQLTLQATFLPPSPLLIYLFPCLWLRCLLVQILRACSVIQYGETFDLNADFVFGCERLLSPTLPRATRLLCTRAPFHLRLADGTFTAHAVTYFSAYWRIHPIALCVQHGWAHAVCKGSLAHTGSLRKAFKAASYDTSRYLNSIMWRKSIAALLVRFITLCFCDPSNDPWLKSQIYHQAS